nr:unnamed protein product [Callosobruchus analis]
MGWKLFLYYDVSHMLKAVRNNSWGRIYILLKGKKKNQFIKLTVEHIIPSKIRKRKVKNCSQVFSYTVATSMHIAAKVSAHLPETSEFYLDPQASDTADCLLFFDKLFDSVNGSLLTPPPGKKIIIPSFTNWMYSLHSLIYLTKHLLAVGFKYVCPGNFDQDPVENYFSCIRSHGVGYVNPTCFAFVNANKSLLLNNLVFKHSLGKRSPFEPPQIPQTIQPSIVQDVYLEPYVTAYIAGYVLKNIMKVRHCQECTKRMCSSIELPSNILIKAQQYDNSTMG